MRLRANLNRPDPRGGEREGEGGDRRGSGRRRFGPAAEQAVVVKGGELQLRIAAGCADRDSNCKPNCISHRDSDCDSDSDPDCESDLTQKLTRRVTRMEKRSDSDTVMMSSSTLQLRKRGRGGARETGPREGNGRGAICTWHLYSRQLCSSSKAP